MFHMGVQRLESASGHHGTDIRLSSELSRAAQSKLRELGLDPRDTTGEELYHALCERLRADEVRLLKSLQEKYGQGSESVMAHVAAALRDVPLPRRVYALKSSAARRILKKVAPKQTMKQLGYRSFDSMLKHEQPAALLAAAWHIENAAWQKHMLEQYRALKSGDFEIRDLQVLAPDSKRWQALTAQLATDKRHTVLSVKEMGAVILLPLPENQPPAAAVVTLLLALHAMNDIRAASTFLKLCQVKPDFGHIVEAIIADEPALDTSLFDRPVPWQIIQRYYARFSSRFREEIFAPHVQTDDLTWHSIEKVLTYIEPSMSFWRHTATLSLLHNHQPVSMNIIDVALSYCNQLPFGRRIVDYSRTSLWHELLIRYLKHDSVEQTVVGGLQAELIESPV
jgi:hypothetical protein